jgi:hypothetical protein
VPTFHVEEDLKFWGSFFALAGVLGGLALIWAAGTMQNRLLTTGWGAAGVDTTMLTMVYWRSSRDCSCEVSCGGRRSHCSFCVI